MSLDLVPAVEDDDATRELGELYAASRRNVWRLVRHVVRGPEEVIDEACQVAWSRLVANRGRVRSAKALSWVITTALHEAMRLVKRSEWETSLEEILEQAGDVEDAGTAPGPEEIIEARARLESIGRLPERQQRLIWLQAFGLSYAEMAADTGQSMRSVERQMVRARRGLSRAA